MEPEFNGLRGTPCSLPREIASRQPRELLRQFIAMFGKIDAAKVALIQIALDAATVVEQPGLAAEAQTVEAGEDKAE